MPDWWLRHYSKSKFSNERLFLVEEDLRFLFLLNNSYFILELKEDLRGHALEAFLAAFAHKVEGYGQLFADILGTHVVLLVQSYSPTFLEKALPTVQVSV